MAQKIPPLVAEPYVPNDPEFFNFTPKWSGLGSNFGTHVAVLKESTSGITGTAVLTESATELAAKTGFAKPKLEPKPPSNVTFKPGQRKFRLED